MNRSILIVICDFLLVSLLAFSSADITNIGEENTSPQVRLELATNQPASGRDLAAVMKLALEDEQKRRELLLGELTRTRETAAERNQQLQSVQQRLQGTEREKAQLEREFAQAQTNLASLDKQFRDSAAQASISQEKLAAMEAELRKRAEEAAAMQQRLAQISQSNQIVLREKQELAGQLQIAQVEKRHATEQVIALKDQVQVEREERAKLAEGVKALATGSTQLVQEIRDNRPLSPNTIFNEFVGNRVRASITAFRSGLFDTNKRKDTGTVLATDGTNIVAFCHVDETPLSFWPSGVQWDSISGSLRRSTNALPIRDVSFHQQDPRVVFMPINPAEARQLGGKVYRMTDTPFKFQEAVLVGADENYYGECKFEIDTTEPAYVKLDRSVLRGLFGKFNPSRGDLVFSKTGELLGIMVNNTYCLVIQSFQGIATISLAPGANAANAGSTLASLQLIVQQKPLKLH